MSASENLKRKWRLLTNYCLRESTTGGGAGNTNTNTNSNTNTNTNKKIESEDKLLCASQDADLIKF